MLGYLRLPVFFLTISLILLSFVYTSDALSEVQLKIRYLESLKEKKTPESRQLAVKHSFLHAWNAYVNYAWGEDELRPVSKTSYNWVHLGLTIVDSLDTLYIMELKNSFDKAKDWVARNLTFEGGSSLSLFETTIRVLGGLLSAYDLSGEYLFLRKAKELGDKMLPAFETRTGIPNPAFSFGKQPVSSGLTFLAEAGTLQMEFVALSKATGEPIYAQKVLKFIEHMEKANLATPGLYGVHVSTESGAVSGHVTLGGTGDSFYEYLLKMDLLLGKKVKRFRRLYESSENAIKKSGMIMKKKGMVFLGNYIGPGTITQSMEHLACFAGGMFALGGDIPLGAEIANTCYQMYRQTPSGIAPEAIEFDDNGLHVSPSASYYLLRPETVESLFVLYRLTKNETYRDMAWDIFMAIEKHCRLAHNGYSGLRTVLSTDPQYDDLQQSFFLAETLKYLYLIFSPPDLIPLDKYVFNTEAHPLKIFKEPFYSWENIVSGFSID